MDEKIKKGLDALEKCCSLCVGAMEAKGQGEFDCSEMAKAGACLAKAVFEPKMNVQGKVCLGCWIGDGEKDLSPLFARFAGGCIGLWCPRKNAKIRKEDCQNRLAVVAYSI